MTAIMGNCVWAIVWLFINSTIEFNVNFQCSSSACVLVAGVNPSTHWAGGSVHTGVVAIPIKGFAHLYMASKPSDDLSAPASSFKPGTFAVNANDASEPVSPLSWRK